MSGKYLKVSHIGRKVTIVLAGTLVAFSATILLPTAASAGPPGGWDPIIQCESGNRNIESRSSSTASGYLQFTNGTWRRFGGTEFAPRAIQATREEQLIVAERAYELNGLRDWRASQDCWDN